MLHLMNDSCFRLLHTSEKIKQMSTTNVITSIFQLLTSLSSVAIIKQHERMEFTFHNNSYAMLVRVASSYFWTELSCWYKNRSNKATFLIDWSHSHRIIRLASRNGQPLRNIQFSNGNGFLPFYVDLIFNWSSTRLLPDLTMSNTAGVL